LKCTIKIKDSKIRTRINIGASMMKEDLATIDSCSLKTFSYANLYHEKQMKAVKM